MAYGTETVPRVDKIVGPGNAYVAEAKLQVSRDVGIDTPAGPSELLVICDDDCNAATIAREVIAQAEHDANASVIVISIGEDAAAKIAAAIDERVPDVVRGDIVRAALGQNGAILSAETIAEAVEFAAEFAPEHLLLAIRNADTVLREIRNAGCVFVGES